MQKMLLLSVLSVFVLWLTCKAPLVQAEQPHPPLPSEITNDGTDWLRLTSGEWLRGEMKAMYNEKLEFKSDKLGLQLIKWSDVHALVTSTAVRVRLRGGEHLAGKLRIDPHTLSLDTGEMIPRADVVTLMSGRPNWRDYWSARLSLGANWRAGNTEQADANAQANLTRRTLISRIAIDYMGNLSQIGEQQTANNHRLNGVWDYFLDGSWFLSPVFGEVFRDTFRNLDYRFTLGSGIGFQLIDNPRTHWHIAGGPGIQRTQFSEVEQGEPSVETTPALTFSTDFDIAITNYLDFDALYQFQLSSEDAGLYNHHAVARFLFELASWIDFDISLVWDRTQNPKPNEDGLVPERDDWLFILGLGFEY
jgi:putative salt-induced outer membrane protein YdiY